MNVQDRPKGSRERTLDEVKAEFMRRAGLLNPFEDIKREDAEKVMAALKNLDKDHWAEEWCKIGLGYEAQADALAKTDGSRDTLRELYMHAFDACRVLASLSSRAQDSSENGFVIRGASRMRLTLISKSKSTLAKPAVPETGAAVR